MIDDKPTEATSSETLKHGQKNNDPKPSNKGCN